nr:ABC transporter permease subunit [Deinococcus sp. JMULE3]
MTSSQRFWRVQVPLALPVWLGGVRQAAVLLVGVAAVAALIGAGGLGTYIFKGLQSAASDLILLGAVPAALLAILVDGALRALEGWLGRRLGRAA